MDRLANIAAAGSRVCERNSGRDAAERGIAVINYSERRGATRRL